MPKGLKRYYSAGDLHFLTCSCYQRKPWLDTGERRDLFLKILEEVRKEHRFMVLGYVVLPEHFHLLISEPQVGTPSTAMQSVKQRFAQRVVPRRRQRRPSRTRPLHKTQGAGHPAWNYLPLRHVAEAILNNGQSRRGEKRRAFARCVG